MAGLQQSGFGMGAGADSGLLRAVQAGGVKREHLKARR